MMRELVKGKWYRCSHWTQTIANRYSEETIDGKHLFDEEVCINSPFRRTNWMTYRNDFIEVPLSEIQQYLPEGHVDKEFILPEEWCIFPTEKEFKAVVEWAALFHEKDYYKDYIWHSDVSFDCKGRYRHYEETRITFAQFNQYVLKKNNMEKEIIGYNLKDLSHEKAYLALCVSGYQRGRTLGLQCDVEKDVNIEALRNACVLDLWFEPVYKEEFKVGDYILLYDLEKSKFNGDIVKITSIRPDKYHEKWISHTPASFSGGGFGYLPFKDNFRLATPEEIKEATKPKFPQIEINGYKGEFENNYVKFGCAEISKEVFIDLFACRKYSHTNRDIESITIGKGTFSKGQIKEIAEYFLTK